MAFCVQVALLVEFLIENCAAVFGEDPVFLFRPSAEESPEHAGSSPGMSVD